jgi:hypothetical protein
MFRAVTSLYPSFLPAVPASRSRSCAVIVAAVLGVACSAPEPGKLGTENNAFADADVVPSSDADPNVKKVPTGFSAMDCGAEAFGDVSIGVTFDDADESVLTWEGADAIGLLVTDRDAVLPIGPGEKVEGTAYWVISTSAFPSGFVGPVSYRKLPDDAEDVTDFHDGPLGGVPLSAGECYKFSVTNDVFLTGSVLRGWE